MTRRQRGWAYVGVVVAVAAAWPLQKLSLALAERSVARMTPAPFATIDAPATNAEVSGQLTVAGRAAHETIRAPLWLLSSEAGRDWRPEGEVATGAGTWKQEIFVGGRKGTRHRLAVVAAEIPLHNRFKQQLHDLEHPPWWPRPCWMNWQEEGGGGCPARTTTPPDDRYRTYPPLPEGAKLVTSVDVVKGPADSRLTPTFSRGERE